ncbi:MAG: 2-isopropylmalate synthase [Desulfofustis sp. PB-SRB1]|jgi:2-isopropylmalate synthase|nr:2-isopropylmalate synthase [Desulfofustis sp. PB-SRB1]MBM1001110.1 2-isopropylmalate synthase [Desulfofustis sp. PB-SRB1]HBH29318.1 2-isopropylmalate synthase [Desulfofustis sp.]HBH32372.1 2-isopropylmalate synthase [Desulfofustis sp.]
MMQHAALKYRPYPSVPLSRRSWPDRRIEHPPAWCSVDLRDGNQALIQPMSLTKKLELWNLLVEIGFKEIEVGFPSASQVEFDFTRHLIENGLIADSVWIQVLTQARQHLIERTFESTRGARRVVLHLYNSTSTVQREVVFNMTRQQIVELAVKGARLVREEAEKYPETEFRYQYSPESFTGTELDFALEVCEAVMAEWGASAEKPVILNLPATVEMATPNIYADQIEWFCTHMKDRDAAIISVHTHNDRGTAVAATEFALMAGAQRVEGTLFGNGERTGNVDLITMALNMFTQGVDPGLDLHDINHLIEVAERVNKIPIHPRHPYAGELVYTAFSGSHQDAINKGMHHYTDFDHKLWDVPYLPIDPTDVGRTYESIIRINSQSGKGGVAYILENKFDLKLPKEMHPEFGKVIQAISEAEGRELKSDEIYQAFRDTYINAHEPYDLHTFHVVKRHSDRREQHSFAQVEATLENSGHEIAIAGNGNGPLDAFANALQEQTAEKFSLRAYHEHALNTGSNAQAAAYIEIETEDGKRFWGVGINTDIIIASVKALLSSLNRAATN